MILFHLFALSLSLVNGASLPKPYTLKIPVLLPIAGPFAPLGDVCTEGVRLLMDTMNNQTRYLPQYNLVADIVDDQCSTDKALAGILPFFMDDKSARDQKFYGSNVIPRVGNVTMSTPPLLIGGMCSAVCLAVTRFAQYFDFINFSANCNSPTLSNRKIYHNFYRIQSDSQVHIAFVNFLVVMKWKRVAVISDTVPEHFQMTTDYIADFFRHNITIVAAEFYIDDPAEAVARVRASGARIIAVNCQYATCPDLACQGYLNGMYGPHFVWFFPGDVNLPVMTRPEYCTLEMIQAIDEDALVINLLRRDYAEVATSIGINGVGLDQYLDKAIVNATQHPWYGARSFCFDNIMPSIFILDHVEKQLNRKNSTIHELASDPYRKMELREMVREGVETMDVRLFSGRVRYEPGAMETQSQFGYTQLQSGKRVFIFHDNGVETVESKYEFPNKFVWKTSDGKAPTGEIKSKQRLLRTPSWAVALIAGIAGFVGLVAVLLLVTNQIALRQNEMILRLGLADQLPLMNDLILISIILLLVAVVLYPLDGVMPLDMPKFCQITPIIVVAAYSLLSSSLILKLNKKVGKKSMEGPKVVQFDFKKPEVILQKSKATIPRNASVTRVSSSVQSRSKQETLVATTSTASHLDSKAKKRNDKARRMMRNDAQKKISSYVAWLIVNAILVALYYSLGGSPIVIELVESTYDSPSDTLISTVRQACSSNTTEGFENVGNHLGAIILALQSLALLVSVIYGVLKQQQLRESNVNPDVAYTAKATFFIFPASMATVLTVIIAKESPDVMYYFVASFVILLCSGTIGVIFLPKYREYTAILSEIGVFGLSMGFNRPVSPETQDRRKQTSNPTERSGPN